MLGAIIGNIVGSQFEWDNNSKASNKNGKSEAS